MRSALAAYTDVGGGGGGAPSSSVRSGRVGRARGVAPHYKAHVNIANDSA